MIDLLTTPIAFAILTALGTFAAIVGARIGHLQLRRTPKPPEPTILPSCTTILGADMSRNDRDLPGYGRSMKRMGLSRHIR
jgi:hypothetical protein